MPVKAGIATFITFLTTGLLTMSPYILTWAIQRRPVHPWPYVLAISALQLFSLGLAKGKVIGLSPWKEAFQFMGLGAVGTSIGFAIGLAFQELA